MGFKHDFKVMDICGDRIAIPVGDSVNSYHGALRLNETAAEIFELLRQGKDEAGIVQVLQAKYEEDADKLTASVHEFLEELKRGGVLQ